MAGVATQNEIYKALLPQWERCRDVTSGTDTVKAKGTKYLPSLDSHKDNPLKYIEYKNRALFYNASGRTVYGLSGGIFQKTPAVNNVDNIVKGHLQDITLTGEPFDMFALEVTREYLITGRYGILVDMPNEEIIELRPYWTGYRAEDIVNWRFRKTGGDQELSLVVLREIIDRMDDTDEFVFKPIIQYRVLRLEDDIYTQQIYKPVEQQQPGSSEEKFEPEPKIVPLRRGQSLNFIPFALPWSVNSPPLIDLVDINISHYQGSADLKHGLHFTALPTPWVSGQLGDKNKPLKIGSGTAWVLEKDGKAGMLEFTGKGLGAIRTDLIEMQKMMASMGARLLQEPPRYAETALSVSMRHSSDFATLRTLAQIVEQQLSQVLKIHIWWLGNLKLITDVIASIELNKVFFDQSITADELRALLLALQSNSISYNTFYSRLAGAGWIREGISAEEELADIKQQPPMIGISPLVAATKLKPEEKLAPT